MTAGSQPLPLTAGQAAIWLAQQLDLSSPAFNTCTSIVIDGQVSKRQVSAAWRQLVEATPAMRLRIGIDEWTGELQQWFAPDGTPTQWDDTVRWDDAGPRASGCQDAELLLDEAVRAPYPIVEPGPLCRLHASRIGRDRVRLSVLAHHVIADGVCQAAIARRLAAGLHGGCITQAEQDYVTLLAQVRKAQAQAQADHSGYWRERLAVSGPIHGPAWSREYPAVEPSDSSTGRLVVAAQTTLEPGLAQRLEEVATLLGCTCFHILLVACHLLLWRVGTATSFVSTAASVRPRGSNPDVVGCFIDQVPLRATLHGEDTLAETARREVPRWRDDLRRRTFPFVDLVRLSRSAGGQPVRLDDLLMTYRRTDGTDSWPQGSLRVTAEFFRPYPETMTGLLIRFVHTPRSLVIQLTCSATVASSIAPQTLLGELAGCVTGVLADPHAPYWQSLPRAG